MNGPNNLILYTHLQEIEKERKTREEEIRRREEQRRQRHAEKDKRPPLQTQNQM